MTASRRGCQRTSTGAVPHAIAVALLALIVGCSGVDDATSNTTSAEGSPNPPGSTSTTSAPDPDIPATSTEAPDDPIPTETGSDLQLATVELGVERLVADGFSVLDGRRVGLITNQVSMVDGRHLIDWMHQAENVELVRIFAAEHGVRGSAGAGELVGDGIDDDTGIEIRSLYGATRQPTPEMLEGIDTIVFDLQDVGTRYYTYTATMGLAMQAAADLGLTFIVLDRPNPLGRVVEGELRVDTQTSFISQYPMPSLHGLSSGELARMIVGELWLPGLDDLDLEVIPMRGWAGEPWSGIDVSWIPPSPGLQTATAAATYPTVVWFEATTLSYGAGTDRAFRAVGAPWLDTEAIIADLDRRNLPGVRFEMVELSPVDIIDIAADPRFEGQTVPGIEVIITNTSTYRPSATGLHLLDAILDGAEAQTVIDRPAVFDLLAGTSEVRIDLLAGVQVSEIVADWDDVAAEFAARSFAYLLYP
jgi:uncharacterized protein YbbC (DUF1343 family)